MVDAAESAVMKRGLALGLGGGVLFVLLLLVVPLPARPADPAPAPGQNPAPAASANPGPAAKPPPGVAAAQALSTLTGVAISPLLGVSAVGAWKYFQTAEPQRARLPWFARPWFWVTGLVLVGLVFLKDVLGTATPAALKRPFDLLELFENKVSALLAAGLFVPIIASVFGDLPQGAGLARELGLAALDAGTLLNALAIPVAIAAFLVVWMLSHVVNVLILLSPFSAVDAVLKSARLLLLALVAGSAVINPWLGAAVALVVILVAILLAGWSMRLIVFGTVFAWDFASLRRHRTTPVREHQASRVFTARRIGSLPVRTCGRLRRDDEGRLVLEHRPWLVGARRAVVLPVGEYWVSRGLVYPEIVHRHEGLIRTLMYVPPRFAGHEDELARAHGLAGVQDSGTLRGMKALWNWLRGWFTPLPAPAGAGTP
ncbi:MAG: hypothetical protein RJA22_2524 [Verrucomicrobiota bacterium]|jgi:hypothetical protein